MTLTLVWRLLHGQIERRYASLDAMMSYSIQVDGYYEGLATFVDRILKGAPGRPASPAANRIRLCAK